jgi:hypothetical protein
VRAGDSRAGCVTESMKGVAMRFRWASCIGMLLTACVLGGALGYGFTYVPNGLSYSMPLGALLGWFIGWCFANYVK